MNSDGLFDRTVTRSGTGFDQTFRHSYRTTIDDLWSAVTVPERIARWLGPVAEPTGDDPTYVINIGSGESAVPATVKIKNCDPPIELIVDWTWQGQPASEVSATLRQVEDQLVELTLRHRDVTSDRLVTGYGGGWESCLLRLGTEVGAEGWTQEQLEGHERAARDAWRDELVRTGW